MLRHLAFALSFFSLVAQAEFYSPPPPSPAPAIPTHLQSGDIYYDASVGGIGKYMADLKGKDPKAYQALLPKLESMRSRQNAALWTGAGLLTAGVFCSVGSFSFLQTEENDILGTRKTVNIPVMLAGTGLVTAAIISYFIISPGRGSLLDFVNEHNRVNSGHPLRWQIGMEPRSGTPTGGFALSF